MASHRRPKQPSRARMTLFGATAAATVALTSQSAFADPGLTKDEVKERVDELHEEAAKATDDYNAAKETEESLQEEAGDLQDAVARGQEELNELRNSLGSAASAQYRSGGLDPSMELFLSADPDAFLDRAATLDQVSGKQADTLRSIEAKQRLLAQQREEATGTLEDLEDIRQEAQEKKDAIQGKLNEAQELLNQLTEEERAAIEAEEAAAEEAARAEAERASRDAGRTDDLESTPSAGGGGGSSYADAAISAAEGKIGTPYVFGTTGPDSFDCSGLTGWAYAQAGISLPRTSQEQANAGTRVSASELQRGDLVLYYDQLSHIAIYVGNGQIIHAPSTGSSVRYDNVNSMPIAFGVRVA